MMARYSSSLLRRATIRCYVRGALMPPKQIRPKSLADYLEVLSKIGFEAGLSWRVVESKWGGIPRAFHGFDPEKGARMKPRAVDKLVRDGSGIRKRGRVEG